MKLYYKFSVVDDYLIIEFNGKKVDVFPREDVFLDADRLLKFKQVHIRYHSDEVVKFTEEFENCSLSETSPVSIQEFLEYFTTERVGLTGGPAIDYTPLLTSILDAINDTSTAEQTILNSIDTKLDELVLIKDELVEANATLVLIKDEAIDINTNTAEIVNQTTLTNTKLDEIKVKLDTQITELGNIKQELIDANISLNTVNTNLVTINDNIVLIKADIAIIKTDIAEIKTSISNIEADTEEIKVAVQSIDTKLTTVNDHLTTIEGKLDTINDTLIEEFDQTQVILGEVKTAIEFAQDTFQVTTCAGDNVGEPENVLKVVQLNKQTSEICNTADISDPIVAAIEAQIQPQPAGKKQDFLSWTAAVNDTLTIPLNKFSTISMLAAKGEFKIENSNNDFSSDITASAGTVSNFIEISEDGVGTATGATSLAQGFDTRANSTDMDTANNSFLITAVREGVLQLELYKNI